MPFKQAITPNDDFDWKSSEVEIKEGDNET